MYLYLSEYANSLTNTDIQQWPQTVWPLEQVKNVLFQALPDSEDTVQTSEEIGDQNMPTTEPEGNYQPHK